jgi:predicted lipid carrier protein YhbT
MLGLAMVTPDPTVELFDRLGRRENDPSLERTRGIVRFDLATDAEILYWSVRIDRGEISVSRAHGDADCIVYTTKARFDRIATGEANAMTMLLRAEIVVHGDVGLLVILERFLPGPPGARGPQLAAGAGRGGEGRR